MSIILNEINLQIPYNLNGLIIIKGDYSIRISSLDLCEKYKFYAAYDSKSKFFVEINCYSFAKDNRYDLDMNQIKDLIEIELENILLKYDFKNPLEFVELEIARLFAAYDEDGKLLVKRLDRDIERFKRKLYKENFDIDKLIIKEVKESEFFK